MVMAPFLFGTGLLGVSWAFPSKHLSSRTSHST